MTPLEPQATGVAHPSNPTAPTDPTSGDGETPALPARKPPLPALSGLRTLLAINIMFFHFTPPLPGFLMPVVNNAYVFVGFFFLISGFVLAYNYADRPRLNKRDFYLARWSRIYPVYLLVLALSWPFLGIEWAAHTHADFWLGAVLTPLALQGWSPQLATFWNTVSWTLPADFFLYGLFPFLLLLVARLPKRLNTAAGVMMLIGVLWVIGFTPHLIYLLTNPDHLPGPATRFSYAHWLRCLKYMPPFYLCTFTCGILVARLHGMLRLTGPGRSWLALTALAGLALFFALGVDHVPYVLVHGALLLPFFAMLLLGLSGPGPVAGLFAFKPLVIFGETTFSLYLLHFNGILLIHYYKLPERLHVTQLDPWISYAAVMTLALAVVYGWERPVRRWLLKHFRETEAPAVPG